MHAYHHVKTEDGRESLTIFTPSGPPIVATGEHPSFAELLSGASAGEPIDDLRNLADLTNAVAQQFDSLSERITVAHGRVFFDGDEVNSTITQQIVRCLNDPSVGDWKPLVLFMENVAANPNEHSREQLFDWLRDRKFTITTNGCFIAYKGVCSRNEGVGSRNEDAEDSYPYESQSSGTAIVNGKRFTGRIPNAAGATVEMPRSDVQHAPSRGCSTGLHVGTYEYAQSYANGALLTVIVNPRDVVSVPTDCGAQKMRVCRYIVSDDEPTSPQAAAAINYAIVSDGEPEIIEYKNIQYEVIEERPPKKCELYWNDTLYGGRPFIANFDHDGISKLIREVEHPEHGDWRPDNGGQFFMACRTALTEKEKGGYRWVAAYGRNKVEFLASHKNCC